MNKKSIKEILKLNISPLIKGKDVVAKDLFLQKLKNLYKQSEANKFQEGHLADLLQKNYWSSGYFKNPENNFIFRKEFDSYMEAEKNGHNIETMKNNLGFERRRIQELISYFIHEDILRSDNDSPRPSYYLVDKKFDIKNNFWFRLSLEIIITLIIAILAGYFIYKFGWN